MNEAMPTMTLSPQAGAAQTPLSVTTPARNCLTMENATMVASAPVSTNAATGP
jgi:hypothetical protein